MYRTGTHSLVHLFCTLHEPLLLCIAQALTHWFTCFARYMNPCFCVLHRHSLTGSLVLHATCTLASVYRRGTHSLVHLFCTLHEPLLCVQGALYLSLMTRALTHCFTDFIYVGRHVWRNIKFVGRVAMCSLLEEGVL